MAGGNGAKFLHCSFDQNFGNGRGGAVALPGPTDMKFISCELTRNTSNGDGGAVYANGGSSTYTNSLFDGNVINSGIRHGGAICTRSGVLSVANCTFVNNVATGQGGAIGLDVHQNSVVTNCIFWGNSAATDSEIANFTYPTVRYSDVQGGWSGTGNNNINATPGFAGPTNYHLACPSPCINSGLNTDVPNDTDDVNENGNLTETTPDRDLAVRIDGTPLQTVDMGAYELQTTQCLGEADGIINPTLGVNIDDLLAVINHWGSCPSCQADVAPTPCHNGVVDIDDLLQVINAWGDPCPAGFNLGGGGAFTSALDCMNAAAGAGFEPHSEDWNNFVNKCVSGLCAAHIIECD
jgi:hypothetical protein